MSSQRSVRQWVRTIKQSNPLHVRHQLQLKNNWKLVKNSIVVVFVYSTLVVIWIVTDNHRELQVQSSETYDEETDTFSNEWAKDCTSDYFIQWGSILVSSLVIPLLCFTMFMISMRKMKKKASGAEKLTILGLINFVTICLVVLFAVLLSYSFIIQKIIISTACLFASLSTATTLKIRTKL